MRMSKKRVQADEERLISPLQNNNSVGDYLRYDPLYDQIKQARLEEDSTLSQGVWAHDLKRADYIEMEELCVNTLEFRSKDLQIAGWLTEAWLELDGLIGLEKGLRLLAQLSNSYWGNLHPQPDEDGYEARIRLYEWMNEQLANRLMKMALTYHSFAPEKDHLTLSDWVFALNQETIAKRSSDYAKAIAEMESKGQPTLSSFRKQLNTTDAEHLQKNYTYVVMALKHLDTLSSFLNQRLGKLSPSFGRVRTCLDDILRICKTSLEQRELPLIYQPKSHNDDGDEQEESAMPHVQSSSSQQNYDQLLATPKQESAVKPTEDDVRTISGRREAYQALREIGLFLQNLDPHSPTPSLIEIIVGWENKTLPAILEDLSQAPHNTQMLIKMLARALPREAA